MGLLKRVSEGEVMPEWYGVAWHENYERVTVCAPVPLNLAIAACRGVWHWMRWGYKPVRISPREAYAQGRRDAAALRGHTPPAARRGEE